MRFGRELFAMGEYLELVMTRPARFPEVKYAPSRLARCRTTQYWRRPPQSTHQSTQAPIARFPDLMIRS